MEAINWKNQLLLKTQGNIDEVDVGQEEKIVDALVLQEAAAEATMHKWVLVMLLRMLGTSLRWPPINKKPDPTPQESQAGKEVQQSDKQVLAKNLEELKAKRGHSAP
ncbi:hypothetical protein D8674_020414 [Pyrus ussuriensis x Pyrus communis]|uniref:Uncharacterized protein n=1 Tax=Pyrus ussuriensis x Pyrus communis TaxID=2448454 RepID=A0A5N5HFM1_9ROSA|nr:hypothetical protein D8674_020400 [Pyrus ussuriensis x Pyrus communis]KAB2626796.1 hypothetical protein D8674_020414 [Pyrus ussuriensis x Pyrus communis]